MAYNTSIQPTTSYSPFFLMLGRTARMLVYGTNTSQRQNVHCFVRDTAAVLERAYQYVRSTMELKQEYQKELYDRRPLQRRGFSMVPFNCCPTWLFSEASSSLDRALQDSKISDITYRIRNCKGRCRRLVVHFTIA